MLRLITGHNNHIIRFSGVYESGGHTGSLIQAIQPIYPKHHMFITSVTHKCYSTPLANYTINKSENTDFTGFNRGRAGFRSSQIRKEKTSVYDYGF